MALYPFSAIGNDNIGLALGSAMDKVYVFQIGYNSKQQEFYISFDLALTNKTDKFSSSASFSLVFYRFDPEWGFRSAAKKYYDIFEDYFVKRVDHEGLWMPFSKISEVSDWQDFGFAFYEGSSEPEFLNTNNIYNFPYIEPGIVHLNMDSSYPRTYSGVMDALQNTIDTGTADEKKLAKSIRTSGIYDSAGNFKYDIESEPWCDGARFPVNIDPGVPTTVTYDINRAGLMSEQVDGYYLKASSGSYDISGIYVDSLETRFNILNYRDEHLGATNTPLTFDKISKEPVLMQSMSAFEFYDNLDSRLHNKGDLLMANSVLLDYPQFARFFDVMGKEVDWIEAGQFVPMDHTDLRFKRTMSYQKPYCFLMNTDFSQMTYALTEEYMQFTTFYGMFPGFFSNNAASNRYFENSDLYNRDRPLFKKYIPIIQDIASAGWEPETYAKTSSSYYLIERFGHGLTDGLYFTVYNTGDSSGTVTITIMADEFGINSDENIYEMVTNTVPSSSYSNGIITIPLTLGIHDTAVLTFPTESQPDMRAGIEHNYQYKSQDLRYYIPLTYKDKPEETRIFFGIHGNARTYGNHFDKWMNLDVPESYNVVLIAPHFDTENFPRYQRLNVGYGERTDLRLIELFDKFTHWLNLKHNTFYMYGFSAGGQFTHRFAMAHPEYIERAVAGGSGVYTFPDSSIAFPHGLDLTEYEPIDLEFNLKASYLAHMSIMIGLNDTLRTNDLSTSEASDAQGLNRLERARNFINATRDVAEINGWILNWSYLEVPDVGHSSIKIRPHAINYLFG
jgi:pimeloyl-ACP methyl ester carboxylesterase